jgi:hypothetical protein
MLRREFLAGATAAACLCTPALAATSASRAFRILRDGDDIGPHTLDAVLTGNGFEIAIDIEIAVKVLGITAYRYTLTNREVWKGGQIVSVKSVVNDDGTEDNANVSRKGDKLVVSGSRYNGDAPLDAATTSYFTPKVLNRKPWISTQSGKLLPVKTGQVSGRKGWWQITGGLETTLGYDARGEWTGCEFDAGGEKAVYEITGQSGAIAALWDQA